MEQKKISLSARHNWFIAHNPQSDTQIFYTIDNQQLHYHRQVKELHGRRIRACFHGWVILSNHPDSVLWSLWNPLTSKLIRLPPLVHTRSSHTSPCLSSPPDVDDQGCSVFMLTSVTVPTIVFCRLDRQIKRLKWIEMSYDKQLRSISGNVDGCFLESPTCCNGKVYAMTTGPYYLFVIQIDIVVTAKEVVISLVPFVEIPHSSCNRCPSYNSFPTTIEFLKGSCLELFCIQVGFKDQEMKTIVHVSLFKLELTSMTWKEVVDLKHAMFFLELASDFAGCYYASAAVNSEKAGYVHILGESGNFINSFSPKDRTISLSSLPCVVRESQASAWAMLEWRFETGHADVKEDKDTQIVMKQVEAANISKTDGESYLLNIPKHMLELIAEHCIGIEYMRFRATCKHCCLAAPPVQWNNKTTLWRLQMYSLVSPWFMVFDNYQGIITFIDPIFGERYFITTPEELKGDYHIYYSRYGWLLMYEIVGELVFYNPFTSDIRKLPPVPYLGSFCFSAPPTSPDCMVVGFTTSGQWHVFIHFVSKDLAWHFFSLNFGGNDPYSYRFPTFSGRDVYAFCNNDKGVDAFKYKSEVDYSWEVVSDKAPISGCKSPTQYFLSSCDQHLLLVIVGEFGESVKVYKLNESTIGWEKVDDLGKHMIYISNTSCICLEAKLPEMGNKIYFPRLLHNDDTKIVFYSLETDRYHTFNDKSIQKSFSVDLSGTKHHCYPQTWIEPSWS